MLCLCIYACPTESQVSLRVYSHCTIITCATPRCLATPASFQEDRGEELSDSCSTRDMISINVPASDPIYHDMISQISLSQGHIKGAVLSSQ